MPILQLKVLRFSEKKNDKSVLEYKDLLCLMLQTSLEKDGFTTNEVIARAALQKRIVEADKSIDLDEYEANQLVAMVESYKWSSATLQLVEFIEDIRALANVLEAIGGGDDDDELVTYRNTIVH